jgi:hypothetical protein
MENFNILWPEYIPAFIRTIKKDDNKIYASNLLKQTNINNIINKNNKKFIELYLTYFAAWIMPMKDIKENLIDNFLRLEPINEGNYRETAASFPTWQLGKKGLVELDNNNNIIEEIYIKHLPNNYINNANLLKENILRK